MAEFNRYWAEEALGEPYAPQDYRWMKSARRAGMLLGGVTCVLTTGALLGAAVYQLVDPAPRVSISSYEIDLATAQPAALAPSQPSNTTTSKSELGSPAPAHSPRIAVAALPMVAPNAAPTAKALAARPGPVPVASRAATQFDTLASTPAAPERTVPAPAASDRRLQVKSPDTTPAAKAEADTRIGLSKAAEGKPTDIASGERLGIREILPDGIVMQNGRRIKNGSPLPNGEMLMGTDAAKGMAETDRRVLVLTP